MNPTTLPIVQFPFTDVAAKLGVALGAGLLVGLEREWAQKEIGVRTFSITALIGALTALHSPGHTMTALVGVLLLVALLNAQSLLKDRSLEMTTSIALIGTLVLGAMAGEGHYFTTATAAVLITMLLAWKLELSKFADALQPEEIRGAVLLGLLSFVIYPLLKDEYVDPWGLINPQRAWVIVVVIAGIGFLNYVLLRLYSTRGLFYAAVLGGLVNSTAAVAELAGAFRGRTHLAHRAIAVLLLTNLAMFIRNGVILGIFAPAAAVRAAVFPLAVMSFATVVLAWMQSNDADSDGEKLKLSSPVSLKRVLKFGAIFLAIEIAGTLAQRHLGNAGFIVVSIIGGAVSSASTTASAATLVAAGRLSPQLAAVATIVASMASALINMPLVYQQTRQMRLTQKLAALTASCVVLGLLTMLVQYVTTPHAR